jgi:alkylhydroperoxidase/carboxymuconolactone decarboxylase family protein YurZ
MLDLRYGRPDAAQAVRGLVAHHARCLFLFREEITMPDTTTLLPSAAARIAKAQPEIWKAYTALGKACTEAGPLDGEAVRLVKLALAMGAGSEGAVHSHARQALAEGIPPEALRHMAFLAITTLGFPQAMRAATWIEDVFATDS